MTVIIDGRKMAQGAKVELKQRVEKLKTKGIIPNLAIILVGEDLASKIYIRVKMKMADEIGVKTELHKFPETVKESELIEFIQKLNKDEKVHGILVQLPLPNHINEINVLDDVSPRKDVDGLNRKNMGDLFLGREFLVPATPKGIIRMLEYHNIHIKGKEAVVVGKGKIAGKPTAMMLMNRYATVTICHRETSNLNEKTKRADILVVAVGKANLITKDMVKEGAVVIDVGINRIDGKVCGDVDFENVKNVASYITPVPGGVGPMTVAMVLENTVIAAENQK
jgi:methylenetetrahydrofolate dehydrogenase (NADP+)/methenyltetrahydrofolate cyclohydrolase